MEPETDDVAVVAVVLTNAGRLCLLRRSASVDFDRGRWHCITGYLPRGEDPAQHALVELQEETGLAVSDLRSLEAGQTLCLVDESGTQWTVFTFRGEVSTAEICINWEHDAYTWVKHLEPSQPDVVPWLRDVLEAVA